MHGPLNVKIFYAVSQCLILITNNNGCFKSVSTTKDSGDQRCVLLLNVLLGSLLTYIRYLRRLSSVITHFIF